MTRTGTPSCHFLTSSAVYRASSMNQNATSMPTRSLRISSISLARQFSKEGSQRMSAAPAVRAVEPGGEDEDQNQE